uniref:Putative neurotoxin LTDF S-09 n=1 Tax=Dolomedes fimbriatus TaxID=1432569 RepID=A0A0K1D8Y3_9ARAC|nr:putative neurotoxin LTDF S-09 [Dolomedes fimbriatus]
MRFCIFFILLLITIVRCEDEILENESNAEETSVVVQEENARGCMKWHGPCNGEDDKSCCKGKCVCWNQRVARGSSRTVTECKCMLW